MENFVFEDAARRLEEIAEQLEKGSLSLEESITLYEEGSKLALQCRNALQTAQQKITEISLASGEGVNKENEQND